MREKKEENRIKIHYFSWVEYISILIAGAVIGAMPGIWYGAGFSALLGPYTLWYLLYWAIVSGLLCALTAYQKYRRYELPIQRLSLGTKQVAGGDFSVFIEPIHTLDKKDYIDTMFDDFNKMVAELGSIETMKNDFIVNVSHEIKTPLAIIKNYTFMLKKGGLTKETQEEYMDAVIGAVDRMSALVSNILKLNKIENQQIETQPIPYDLCDQLCRCALQYESLWEEKQITFDVDIEDRAVITEDETLLELVWNNLISNALKFTEPGGSVTLKQFSSENNITVVISDTGCGMDKETQSHIFDKFYQGDSSHFTEGNGLGLALAYRVVERIGATLSVESEPGKGSRFTVNIPV